MFLKLAGRHSAVTSYQLGVYVRKYFADTLRILYGQNGMWYRMNASGTHEYLLEANDGMAIKVIAYRTNFDSLHCTINRFCIEEYKNEEQ